MITRGICKHLGCQCVHFLHCCLSANTRPQEKVSLENYQPCPQLSHGQSLYYGQAGSRVVQLWSCCLQPEPPFYVLLILFPRLFTYEQEHYQQTFSHAMGSPVSATIANLVMEYIEEKAISTAAHPPRWWYRYVDDSHACLKKDYVQEFHDHLNSVNPNIQFTREVEQGNRLSFLDTTTTRVCGRIQVSVYRKPTHTEKYLDYHPSQHKRSVVNTLLHRAPKNSVHKCRAVQREEARHQSAEGQQLPSEFYLELQGLPQLVPPRSEYQRLFQGQRIVSVTFRCSPVCQRRL